MTTTPATSYQLYVGADIAAKSATVVWQGPVGTTPAPLTINQTSAGVAILIEKLKATGVAPAQTLIVMEATGSYWISLATQLHQAGYVVSVANPAHVHHYAKSRGRRAKTDAIDAKTLAEFAMERRPPAWSPPPAIYHELRQRLMARDLLLTMRQQARNHHHALSQLPTIVASVLTQLQTTIEALDQQIGTLDAEIAQVLADGAWNASAKLLQTIPGVGPVTTSWFLVTTLNGTLGHTADEIAAYVGLAPMPRESGTSVRGRARIGHDGSGHLRTALYLATLSAAQTNPVIKAFYNRLRDAGKPHKVARCAAARKLLHIAWAVVTKQQPFDPNHQPTATSVALATAAA